jgi:hypothetical protein
MRAQTGVAFGREGGDVPAPKRTIILARKARTTLWALLSLVLAPVGMPALAHHSFAVFFDTDAQLRKVTGVVKEFRFTNPHGVVTISVREGNDEIIWRAETNSPSILRRRGWSADSLHVGETVTLEGWPARDGSRYMRLRSATRANGEPVGTTPTPVQEK